MIQAPFLAVMAVVSLANVFLAILVLLFAPRRVVSRSFAVFTLGISIWAGGLFMLSKTGIIIFDQITLYGGLLSVFGLVLFAHVFPSRREVSRIFWITIIPLIVLATLVPFNLITENPTVMPDGSLVHTNGPAFGLFSGIMTLFVIYAMWLIFGHYNRSSGLERLQLAYLILGLIIFLGSAIIFDIILPALGVFSLNFLGPVASLAFTSLVAYALIKHHLLDIKVVVQKSLMYTVFLTLVVAIYLIIVQLLGNAITDEAITTTFAAAITTLAGVIGAPFVMKWFRAVTDPIFFKGDYDYAKLLHSLSQTLNETLDTQKIIKETSATLKKELRVETVRWVLSGSAGKANPTRVDHIDTALLFKFFKKNPQILVSEEIPAMLDSKDTLAGERRLLGKIYNERKEADMGVFVPLMSGRQVSGFIMVGFKRSGDSYTSQDIRLLSTFSHQAVTALKKAELYRKVRVYSKELEKKVEERTMELKSAHEDQKKMMIDIAHNLQTPLTVVKGEIGAIKQGSLSNKVFDKLENSIDEVSRFIYDMLRLAKLDADQDSQPFKRLDMSALVEQLGESFATIADAEGIKFNTDIEPGVYIMGDRRKLEEMMTNLVSNAFKYFAHDKKHSVSISLLSQNNDAKIVVSDTGIGIAPEDMPKIFDRFYRGKKPSGSSYGGVGLGLAIAKKIVDIHKGVINAKANPGGGTIFEIIIPKGE